MRPHLHQLTLVKQLNIRSRNQEIKYHNFGRRPNRMKSMRLPLVENSRVQRYNENSRLPPTEIHQRFEHLVFSLWIQRTTWLIQN